MCWSIMGIELLCNAIEGHSTAGDSTREKKQQHGLE